LRTEEIAWPRRRVRLFVLPALAHAPTLSGKETLKVTTMTETLTRDISKAEVERFLYGKHITACPACGRFRSQCDLEVHSISCQRAQSTSLQTASTPVDVLMVVCQNCGAIQFHDRTVVAKWLDCQRRVK
jgi:hypothetical protein